MSIFYNKKTVKLIKWGTYWLSETPDKPSMGWDAACKRTATWALMQHKASGKKFYYVNTHLDHVGKEARQKGLELIVERIASMNPEGYPDEGITYNAWGKTENAAVIDHIYFSGFSSCPVFEVVTKPYMERKFISDHFPVRAVLVF